jgi:hypothetical protein
VVPPGDVLLDVLPATLLFAVGITLVVAPLTTALMSSVPVRNAGLGSAINNAISRVGQPLILAVLFIAINATFYGTLASRIPGADVSSAAFRDGVQPLNRPTAELPQDQLAIVNSASTDAFHLAMLVSAALLLGGAAVNGLGLRTGRTVEVDSEAPLALG